MGELTLGGRTMGARSTLACGLLVGAFLTTVLVPGAASAQPIFGGFVEAVQAFRIEENAALDDGHFGERTYPRSEVRAQLTVRGFSERGGFFIRTDVVRDVSGLADDEVEVDLREAFVTVQPISWLDLKIGRQVATWGTGDLIFANDLFAKDWEAFFTALDDSYLKPPQDLLRMSAYAGGTVFELAASPRFTPDNLPDGRRLPLFNPFLARTVGADEVPPIESRARTLHNGELFARVHGQMRSTEWALYGYKGFWPTPKGATSGGALYHPQLASFGGSARSPVGASLFHAEVAYYASEDDTDGDDPLVANSEVRGFVGVERSLGSDLTAGIQYLVEWMQDHDCFVASLAPGSPAADELRSTVTLRLNKLALQQNLQMGLFAYWGISDADWHLRPAVSYKTGDAILWTFGASLIGGDEAFTRFGQFQDNSNVFGRLRYTF
jgi:hypothetical protein